MARGMYLSEGHMSSFTWNGVVQTAENEQWLQSTQCFSCSDIYRPADLCAYVFVTKPGSNAQSCSFVLMYLSECAVNGHDVQLMIIGCWCIVLWGFGQQVFCR